MLYDPKWKTPVKIDPWSLSAFIAWAKTKPGDEVFDYCLPWSCAIAQWRMHLGLDEIIVVSTQIPEPFKKLVDHPGSGGRQTFGQMVGRYERST